MRSTVADAALRAISNMTRGIIKKVDDTKLLQYVDIEGLYNEIKTGVERFQNYGFSAVPKKEDGTKQEDKAAECLIMYVGGNRAHGIVIAVDDRRYRLQKLAEGEVAIYDDQKQQIHITRSGVFVSVPNDKKVVTQIMPAEQQQQSQSQGTQQQGSQKKQYGTTAQAGQKAYATHTLTKDSLTVNHPGQIIHQIVDENGNVKSMFTMDKNGITHQADNITQTANKVMALNAGQSITDTAPTITAVGTTHGWNM